MPMPRAVPACTLLALASVASADIISFDDIPIGNDVATWDGNRYASLGVVFAPGPQAVLIAAAGSFDTAPVFVAASRQFPRADSAITMLFQDTSGAPRPVQAVSFNVIDFGGTGGELWNASAFDRNGQSLGVVINNGGAFNQPFLVSFLRPSPDIFRVVFTPSDDFEGIDTLHFDVPGPGTSCLVGVLAASKAFLRRRRPGLR